MTTAFKYEDLNKNDLEQFESFFKIYSNSIEKSEQKPKDKVKQISQRSDYLIRLVSSSSEVVGFTLSFVNIEKKFALLEYMAVDQTKRSHGLGSELLKDLTASLKSKNLDWLVIEVDSPYQKSTNQSERIRRVKFYEKNECLEIDSFNYILPLPTAPLDLEMKLLLNKINKSKPDEVDSKSVMQMVQDIYVKVYSCEQTDKRLQKMFSNLQEKLKLKKTGDIHV